MTENAIEAAVTDFMESAAAVMQGQNEALAGIKARLDEFETGRPAAGVGRVTVASAPQGEDRRGARAEVLGPVARHSGTFGFAHAGDYFAAVRQAGIRGGAVDDRLMAAAPSTWGNEGSGTDGGYAVPPTFRTAIMEKAFGGDSLISRTMQVPVSGNSLTVPTSMTTPWGATGIQAYWEAEAAAITQSKPSLENVTIRLHKLAALVPVSDELLEDAPAMGALVSSEASAKIDFKLSHAIAWGTGAGQPLGFMNSPVLITQGAESSQVADTIVAANVVKMSSRMPVQSRTSAVWLIHPDAEPQLPLMTIGDQPIYLPPGGFRDTPFGSLLGRPVIPHQVCETVGDLGDIIFADFGQYLTAIKSGGLRAETSIERRGQTLDRSLASTGSRFGEAFAGLARSGGAIAAAAAIAAIGKAVNDVVRNGQQLRLIEGRFTALTGSAERGARALQSVVDVSRRTGVSIDDVATAMSRFTLAAQDIERWDEEVRKFTENLLQLGRIGGSSATEISNASVQLSQGLAAGALRGEELNSVLEGMPLVARAIADELGVGIGELKEMGKEGNILSDRVFQAVLNKTDEIEKQISSLPTTTAQATERMATAWAVLTAEVDKNLGLSRNLASVWSAIAEQMEQTAARMQDTAGATRDAARGVSDSLQTGGASEAIRTPSGILLGSVNRRGYGPDDPRAGRGDRDFIPPGAGQIRTTPRGLPPEATALGTPGQYGAEPVRPGVNAPMRAPSPDGRPFRVIDIDADIPSARRGGGGGGRSTGDDTARDLVSDLNERIRLLQQESVLIRQTERDRVVLEAAFEREKTVRELVLAAQRQGATITQEELVVAQNLAAGIEEITIANYDLEQAQRRAAEATERQAEAQKKLAEGIADVSDRFSRAIQSADSFAEALKNIGVEIANIAVQGAAGQGPLGGFLGPLVQSAISGIAGGLGGGFGGPSLGGIGSGIYAKGGAFSRGRMIPFARGGIVRRPTVFPMADGMGLMGEAGPEAVLPLRRGPNGRLGVEASGGSAVIMNVNVVNRAGPGVNVQTTQTGRELEIMIDRANARLIGRGGSSTAQALSGRGQLRRR